MRNFRKAALAGATAVAVAFGSTTMAVAEDKGPEAETNQSSTSSSSEDKGTTTPSDDNKGTSKASTKIGAGLGAYDKDGKATGADGRAIFGSDKTGFGEQPAWAKAFYAVTVFSAVSALIGLVVGPAYNFVVHGLPNL